LTIISYGAVPMTIYQALRGYSEGITETRTVFLISLAIFLLNIPFNYLFIFYFDMGGVGCGYATTLLVILGLICFWLITLFSEKYEETRLYGKFIGPELNSSMELFKIGMPISFGVFVELSMFSGAALIISFFGATALAAHTIALNLVGLLFMLPLSLGLASAIRIGNLVGEKKLCSSELCNQPLTKDLSFYCLFKYVNNFAFWLIFDLYIYKQFRSSGDGFSSAVLCRSISDT